MLTIFVALFLRYTAAGRRFQAVGANPRAAWMAGIHVRTHVVFAYTAAGALYGAAAVLLASVLGLSQAMQYVVFGAAILAGMIVSGDRIAAMLGRVLQHPRAGALLGVAGSLEVDERSEAAEVTA